MKKGYLLLLIPLLMSSCSKWVAPPYTSVDRMLKVEKEMTSKQVDEILGIKPYNILHRNDSSAIFEYNYRLKDRKVEGISNINKFIHIERSQTGGITWFNKPSKFYILYLNNRLATIITENGLENSDYLLMKNNGLFLISESELVRFDLFEDANYLHKIGKTKTTSGKANLHHSLLYSANIPYGILGLKYAIGSKIGGYVSCNYSLAFSQFSYFTGGLLFRISPNIDIYAGVGSGPEYYSYYSYNRLYGLDCFILEGGGIFQLRSFSVDLGLGFKTEEDDSFSRLYGKIGFGINF